MKELLQAHLRRIEWDDLGVPIRLYPFTRRRALDEPKHMSSTHLFRSDAPSCGTGIVTELVAERFKAGELSDELATDYGCDREKIEEAIRCELNLAEAA